MMIVRLTVILAMVLSLGIASTSASYQQPKRPSRAEAERAREIEKQKRDAAAQAREEAIEAAKKFFAEFHAEGCNQPGDWTRKSVLPRQRTAAPVELLPQRYAFTQIRGLHPIDSPTRDGFGEPDAATKANHPDVDFVAEFYITADIQRSLYCFVPEPRASVDPFFSSCKWTEWTQRGGVMSLYLWRRGGTWQIRGRSFYGDLYINEDNHPLRFKPTCDEVRLGKSEEAQAVERAEALKKKAIESEHNAEIKEYLEEANQAFELQYKGVLDTLFTSCRAVKSSCYYKVGNYTWTVGEGRVKDGRTPWGPWGDGYGPNKANPAQMYYEKPVTITISGLQGSCRSRMVPNEKFEVRLQYHFGQTNRAWRLATGSTPMNAYYDAPDDINNIDMAALRARDDAPKLCR